MSKPNAKSKKEFIAEIWRYYKENGRHDLPWRHDTSPYSIVVSEVMLQQTQVTRVLKKYPEFLEEFPSFEALASAELEDVLRVWQGMGYNRRAISVRKLAQEVVGKYQGTLPETPKLLIELPGIGKGTAGSIAAFAHNYPAPFIETNIRRVYIHFFFSEQEKVSDDEIMTLVRDTIDIARAREWYWALMDYGSKLAKEVVNPNRRSKHYRVQSKFEGSNRQVRGAILKVLLACGPLSLAGLAEETAMPQLRIAPSVAQLVKEGFVREDQNQYYLNQ